MNCDQYTYTSIPEQLKEHIHREIFVYVKNYHIKRENLKENIVHLMLKNNNLFCELSATINEVNSGISEQNYTHEFIGNTISKLEAKLEKLKKETTNLEDQLNLIDAKYQLYLSNDGFQLLDRTQDEHVFAFINDGIILN